MPSSAETLALWSRRRADSPLNDHRNPALVVSPTKREQSSTRGGCGQRSQREARPVVAYTSQYRGVSIWRNCQLSTRDLEDVLRKSSARVWT